MKKKIKDLTLKERKKICAKHKSCDECPLRTGYTTCGINNSNMESEVEVDE